MKREIISTLVLFSILVQSTYNYKAPLLHCDSDKKIPGQYLVLFNESTSVMEADKFLLQNNYQNSVNIKYRYRTLVNGFAGSLDDQTLQDMLLNPIVKHIECDQLFRAIDCSAPQPSKSWGLNRIAERELALDDQYSYPSPGGKGINAYIIDTGIYVENVDFGGRAVFGFRAEDTWSDTDKNGHGTHVASTVAGNVFGVAPLVDQIIAVKVLSDSGSGSTAGVVAGVEFVGKDATQKGKRSVANLSLGGGTSTTLDNAVNKLMQGNVVVVVAAGNDNQDACYYSPARASDVITTCSTDTANVGSNIVDIRSYFSNFGKCVDICAPGSSITAAWIGSTTATRTISGTSMASPHVCGVAALLLSQKPTSTSFQIKEEILSTSTSNLIDMSCTSSSCKATPNKLLNNGCRV